MKKGCFKKMCIRGDPLNDTVIQSVVNRNRAAWPVQNDFLLLPLRVLHASMIYFICCLKVYFSFDRMCV